MSYLVAIPEDRFSGDEAHLMPSWVFLSRWVWNSLVSVLGYCLFNLFYKNVNFNISIFQHDKMSYTRIIILS